jgi:hypothetical protein
MAFLMILLLKVPGLISLYTMFPVKVAWAPLVHILIAFVYHFSSLHAALQYGTVLQHNPWVQWIVTSFNDSLTDVAQFPLSLFGDAHQETVAKLRQPEAFLSSAQCLLCLWLIAQSTVCWVGLLLRVREELDERRTFLTAARLPAEVEVGPVKHTLCCLAVMDVIVCVHLVAYLPLLASKSSAGAQQASPWLHS